MSGCSTCPSKNKCSSKDTVGAQGCGKLLPKYGEIKN